MKRATAVVSALALVLAGASLAAQAKPNFAGKWVCTDCPAPGGGGGGGGRGGGLGPEFTAAQDATSLTITRAMGETTVAMKYNLDGTESKNMMMGRGGQQELVSKAVWQGSSLVITTTVGQGERKQVLSLKDGNLVVETTNPGRQGGAPTTTTQTYKKG